MHIFKSACVHLAIVTCLVLFGSATHQVQKQTHVEHVLFMPADLPIPWVRPVSMERPTVARVAPSAPGTLRLNKEVVQLEPAPMALSNAESTVELPEVSTPRVTLAQQVTVGVFASAGSGSNHQGETVNQAVSQGTGSSGAGRLVAAGFNTTPELLAVTRRVLQPPSAPVITYEPAAVYSEAARAARIQGTVDVRVKFRLDGSIEVLEITNGLPGLNESALAVIRGIKFTPGAEDFTTTVHVRFELL